MMRTMAQATHAEITSWLDAAKRIAREGGAVVLHGYRSAKRTAREKNRADWVTDTDHASEAAMVASIESLWPEHGILGEERGFVRRDARVRWLLDPLDGTSNFVRRVPHCSVLVAVQQRIDEAWVTEVGVVYDPLRDELFSAQRGHGAQLDGIDIAVSDTPTLERGFYSTGFPKRRAELPISESNHREYAHLNWMSHGVRRFGSAGLDLAYVASGRLDGFWEGGLGAWDVAAGDLLVREAGGTSTTIDGAPLPTGADWQGPVIIATNGRLHQPLIDYLAAVRNTPI